jgi:hypothetical protein
MRERKTTVDRVALAEVCRAEEKLREAATEERRRSSPVNNAGRRGTPWLFGICKYSRLQGRCPQRAKTLQIRAPVDACRAA